MNKKSVASWLRMQSYILGYKSAAIKTSAALSVAHHTQFRCSYYLGHQTDNTELYTQLKEHITYKLYDN